MLLLTEISKASSSRMVSYHYMSPSSYRYLMLKSLHLEFTKAQRTAVSNLAELHKAHVLHHWRLIGIPMISQEVKHADASTVANCHLCNHPFRNL